MESEVLNVIDTESKMKKFISQDEFNMGSVVEELSDDETLTQTEMYGYNNFTKTKAYNENQQSSVASYSKHSLPSYMVSKSCMPMSDIKDPSMSGYNLGKINIFKIIFQTKHFLYHKN